VFAAKPAVNYIVMATGADGNWVRVWPSSVQVLGHALDGRSEPRTVFPELVFIPPNSVALLRGDLVHAGAGGADGTSEPACLPGGDAGGSGLAYSHRIGLHMCVRDKDVPARTETRSVAILQTAFSM